MGKSTARLHVNLFFSCAWGKADQWHACCMDLENHSWRSIMALWWVKCIPACYLGNIVQLLGVFIESVHWMQMISLPQQLEVLFFQHPCNNIYNHWLRPTCHMGRTKHTTHQAVTMLCPPAIPLSSEALKFSWLVKQAENLMLNIRAKLLGVS
jgi:hypothetical protein